ncbi:hypothetical protein LTR84_012489 [Exophiala bonariae]|uniref:Arylformamidase n=1 Tax=Exophiala bonariae TaxID=1690606 RepID=A0AAV9NHZ1_9EURO|nr:hypothetical protein LTR84_012489 [Exophiala bonariae]
MAVPSLISDPAAFYNARNRFPVTSESTFDCSSQQDLTCDAGFWKYETVHQKLTNVTQSLGSFPVQRACAAMHLAAGIKDEAKRRSSSHEHEQFFVATKQSRLNGRSTHSAQIDPASVRHSPSTTPQDDRREVNSTDAQQEQGYPDPSDKYARRQRNKTKSNRYELKESKSKSHEKISSKRTRRQKPSATLKEDFHAPNVHVKRLTLKPSLGAGIFGKGKASLPTQMQGLPDLTFSEMRFLSRQDDHNVKRQILHSDNNALKRAKSTPNEEISRFFSHTEENEARFNSKDLQLDKCATGSLPRDLSTKAVTPALATTADAMSWSISSPRHSHSLREERRQSTSIPASSLHLNQCYRRVSHGSAPRTPEVHPMSSASNCILRQHTDHVLMSDVRNPSQPNLQYLSLDDLKRLAMRPTRQETTTAGLRLDSDYMYHHELSENGVDLYRRVSEGDEFYPVGSVGRGGANNDASQAFPPRSASLMKDQSDPFRHPLPASHGTHLEFPASRPHHPETTMTDARISASRLMVQMDAHSPTLQSADKALHSSGHDNYVAEGYADGFHDEPTCPSSLEQDLEALDQFDIELLGFGCYGGVVSNGMINDRELTVRDANPVEDALFNASASGDVGDANVENAYNNVGGTAIQSRYLERTPSRRPLDDLPESNPLCNTFGLISRTLREPSEQVFTGNMTRCFELSNRMNKAAIMRNRNAIPYWRQGYNHKYMQDQALEASEQKHSGVAYLSSRDKEPQQRERHRRQTEHTSHHQSRAGNPSSATHSFPTHVSGGGGYTGASNGGPSPKRTPSPLPDKIQREISRHQYAQDNILQSYELYIPEQDASHAHASQAQDKKFWIIFIHGGYFRDDSVTAASFHPALSILTKAPKLHLQHLIKPSEDQENIIPYVGGYASINYRLSPRLTKSPQDPDTTPAYELRDAAWPDHIHDVLTAIAHLQRKHGFGQRYLLVGHSVGATMALLSTLASGKTLTNTAGAKPPRMLPTIVPPMAALGVSGIYDFGLLHDSFPEYADLTHNAIRDPRDVALASPARYSPAEYRDTWAQRDTQKRVLILAHSRDDDLVDWKQVEAMAAVFASESDSPSKSKSQSPRPGGRVAAPGADSFAVQVVEMKGKHDEIWGLGTELARVIRMGIGALRRLDRL